MIPWTGFAIRRRAARRSLHSEFFGRAAFEFDVGQTHGEITVLRIIGEQPAIEMLIHHRRGNSEMQRRRSAVNQGLRVKLCFDCWCVSNNSQMCAACEQAQVARMLW